MTSGWASPLIAAPVALLVSLAAATSPSAAANRERLRVEGLVDAEYWNTRGESRLLSLNEDDPAGQGRLRIWAVGDLATGFQGFVLGAIEGGQATADGESETETAIEQAFVRYSFQTRPLMLEAGRIVSPIGNFSRRYLSDRNPLIGAPAGYSVDYPYGIQVTGKAGLLDFTAAVVDKPLVSEAWVPEPASDPRPAIAAGVTPFVGARVGAFATAGTYLGDEAGEFLASGERTSDFSQVVYGIDVHFSRGYFELNGELARSSYEVPEVGDVRGVAWFIEPKYTFTPRLFGALRYERNEYPFIRPLAPAVWLGVTSTFSALEAGVGYRVLPRLILKASYRRDHWYERDRSFFPSGQSFAAQISYSFDVSSWFQRPL